MYIKSLQYSIEAQFTNYSHLKTRLVKDSSHEFVVISICLFLEMAKFIPSKNLNLSGYLSGSPRQNRVKLKRFVWQRRLLLVVVAALCIFLIDLLMPVKAPTQQAFIPSTTQSLQQYKTFSVTHRFQGKIIRKINIKNKKKVIALTFDDGPWPNTTSQILDILKENNIKATFFMIGQNLKNFPQIGQQVVADGHAIGNHTWHHWHRQMNEFTAAREIDDTAALLYKITCVKTSLFRPPNGFLYNGLADYARKQDDVVVLWSIDSGDWHKHGISVEGLVKYVLQKAKPGAIVLMHDGSGVSNASRISGLRSLTVEALPKIIDELKKQDYEFVSVPELLQMQDPQLT